MIGKWIVRGGVAVVGLALVGGLMFGDNLVSYARSSISAIHNKVKGAVPIEFELTRARDLLDQIIPEMQANIQRIAEEEVELANLKQDISQSTANLADERARMARLRQTVNVEQAAYRIGNHQYTRQQVIDDMAQRFERIKEAQVVLAGKQHLLVQREQTLAAAEQTLEKTRHQKMLLQDKIEALTSQHRLVEAASVGSGMQLDNSKLAQTEKLIGEIQKRLDVAERVLARQSTFVQPIEVNVVDESDLFAQVDEYLHGPTEPAATTADAGDSAANVVETNPMAQP